MAGYSREHLRTTVFTSVDLVDPDGQWELMGVSRNLSSRGLLVALPDPVAVGSKWNLCFSFPGVKAPIQCAAECLRCGEEYVPARSAPVYLGAFGFLGLDPALAFQLERAVTRAADSVVTFLGDFEAFSGVPGELLLRLASAFRSLLLRDGESLAPDPDLAGSLILVRSGLVKLSRPGFSQGRETVYLGSRGHVLGEHALLTGEPHHLRLRALAPSQVFVLGPRAQAYLVQEEPEVAAWLEGALEQIAARRAGAGFPKLMPLGLPVVGVGH